MLDKIFIGLMVFLTGVMAMPIVEMTPPSPVKIKLNSRQQFTCSITVQTDWRAVQFYDRSDPRSSPIATFYNAGTNCAFFDLAYDDKAIYEISCGTLGKFHFTIKSVTTKHHNNTVDCEAQYGTGGSSDIFVLDSTVILVMLDGIVDVTPLSPVEVLVNSRQQFTCIIIVQTNWRSVQIYDRSDQRISSITTFYNNGNCAFFDLSVKDKDIYEISCGTTLGTFHFTIKSVTTKHHNKTVECEAQYGIGDSSDIFVRNSTIITVIIPVTTVTITTGGNATFVDVVEGHVETFICTTDSSRPAALIQWYIGGKNVTNQAQPQTPQTNRDTYISSSKLFYTGVDDDHNKLVYCEASNIESKDKVISQAKSIFINTGPKGINLNPANNSYIVSETKGLNRVICEAFCRPQCNYTWTGPNGFREHLTNLQLDSVYRNQTGQYMCHAKNDFGDQISDQINISVSYAPTILQLKALNSNTIDEHQEVTFQCEVDSYPAPDIAWIFSTTNTQLNKEEHVFKSNYSILKSHCLQTGSYRCQASNVIDATLFNASGEIDLFVLCSVRKDQRYIETSEYNSIIENGELNITVFLLAYPKPLISWTVRNSETGVISTVKSSNSFDIFEHISTVYIKHISENDYGVYTMIAFNNLGLQYIQSFSVVPQGPPNQPTEILVACDITSIIVSWKPGLNGGETQKFRVAWLNSNTQQKEYTSEIMDSNPGQHKQYIVKALDPDTMYSIYVEAANKYGIVRSTENTNCTTGSSLYDSQSINSLIMSVCVGIGSAALMLLVAGLVVCILKRRTYNKDENSKLYQTTHIAKSPQKTMDDQHDYNELQTIGTDSNPDNVHTNSSSAYEEIGKFNDVHNVQDENYDNTETREQSKMPALYSNTQN